MIIYGYAVIFTTLLIPNLCIVGGYYLYCASRSGVQTLNLFDDELIYSFYSGSGDNRTTNTYHIKAIKSFTFTDRTLTIKGKIKIKESGEFTGSKEVHRVTIPRTFDNEELVFDFFKRITV